MKKDVKYFTAVIFLYIAVGVNGSPFECIALLPTDAMNSLAERGVQFPNADELDTICPGLMSYLNCSETSMKADPEYFDDEQKRVFQSLEVSFKDLCEENSSARSRYLENVECLKLTEDLWPACKSAAMEGYVLYKLSNETALPNEKSCFETAHEVACMSSHVQKTCGQDALSIYQHFMSKSRLLAHTCEPKTAEALRTKYLDHLKLDEEFKQIYKEAFSRAR